MTTPHRMDRRRNIRSLQGANTTHAALEPRPARLAHQHATPGGPAVARVRLLVPPPLRKGDLVGVAAPGFAVERVKVEAGVRVLERLGLRVRLGASVFARD